MLVVGAAKPVGTIGPEFLGEFLLANAFELTSRSEWMATISDSTEIVVPDLDGRPNPRSVTKVSSVLQSRAYLQSRALELVRPLTHGRGAWRLVTLDFGNAAERVRCEFLMCFAFQADGQELSIDCPYAEVGFHLLPQGDDRPLFILTLGTSSERA